MIENISWNLKKRIIFSYLFEIHPFNSKTESRLIAQILTKLLWPNIDAVTKKSLISFNYTNSFLNYINLKDTLRSREALTTENQEMFYLVLPIWRYTRFMYLQHTIAIMWDNEFHLDISLFLFWIIKKRKS